MNFGENLKRIRKEKHLTIDMMAFRSGFSHGEIRDFEKRSDAPDITSVKRLAIALETKPEELLK